MRQRRKKPNIARQEEEVSNWSELCPDLLRCVFKRLSFTELSRAKPVCSSWHSGSRGCVPKENKIPWLILFPHGEEANNKLWLFVPEDKGKVYKTRDLNFDFSSSRCLATYGSWVLMIDTYLCNYVYIINPLTHERIDLPKLVVRTSLYSLKACFWIDNKTKDYLVVLKTPDSTVSTKKRDSDNNNKWHEVRGFVGYREIVYVHKDQKLYLYNPDDRIKILDFSGDKPCENRYLDCGRINRYDLPYWKNSFDLRTCIAVTVSGDVLNVKFYIDEDSERWWFHVYKANHLKREWEEIYSLGDETLILDMGVTVVAKDVEGVKRNSIYFSGIDHGRRDPDKIFVFDLTIKKIETLPQCVFSSIKFSDARWFFPDFSG